MLQPHVIQAEAQLVVHAETATWPRPMLVGSDLLRVVDAERARQQRVVYALTVRRREGVDVEPEALQQEGAGGVLPQRRNFVLSIPPKAQKEIEARSKF
jgi:hypothetical protein